MHRSPPLCFSDTTFLRDKRGSVNDFAFFLFLQVAGDQRWRPISTTGRPLSPSADEPSEESSPNPGVTVPPPPTPFLSTLSLSFSMSALWRVYAGKTAQSRESENLSEAVFLRDESLGSPLFYSSSPRRCSLCSHGGAARRPALRKLLFIFQRGRQDAVDETDLYPFFSFFFSAGDGSGMKCP